MISMEVEKSVAALYVALEHSPKKLRKQLAIAVNQVAKKTESLLAKEIAKELATPQKEIKATIAVTSKATSDNLSSNVRQKKTRRISLKRFGGRQNKKGVRYKISKTKGSKQINGAFISEKLGGHVYKRNTKKRLPIDKLWGPSPWGVTVQNNLDDLLIKRDIEPELIKAIEKRIRFINFKKTQGN